MQHKSENLVQVKSLGVAVALASYAFALGGAEIARAAGEYPQRAGDVVSFQPFREESPEVTLAQGGRAQLINLNKYVGTSFLLRVQGAPGLPASNSAGGAVYHLEKAATIKLNDVKVSLVPEGLLVTEGTQKSICQFAAPGSALAQANRKAPYVAICGSTIFVRHQASGASGGLFSWGADVLRSISPEAETVIQAVKEGREDKDRIAGAELDRKSAPVGSSPDRPKRAQIASNLQDRVMSVPYEIEVAEARSSGEPLLTGEWYSAKNAKPGIYFSVMYPNHVAPELLKTYTDRVDALDSVEAQSAAYLVAFDLSKFEVGWQSGTDMPEAGWSSEPMTQALRAGDTMAGPDGFGSFSPLARPGVVNPSLLPRLAGVMCGGFQRKHGVFKDGPMSKANFGNYWGFIENGVLMSRLNPGLATFAVDVNGQIKFKTWQDSDNAAPSLATIRHARQNGVPLIDGIDGKGISIPGQYVSIARTGRAGAWSGSASGETRSPRSAMCISTQNGRQYLIYGYFSSAKPTAIVRVFQSQHCDYAMHLDMNSPQQAYFGLVTSNGGSFDTENPAPGMSNVTGSFQGKKAELPRYVGQPDKSDAFYFLAK